MYLDHEANSQQPRLPSLSFSHGPILLKDDREVYITDYKRKTMKSQSSLQLLDQVGKIEIATLDERKIGDRQITQIVRQHH